MRYLFNPEKALASILYILSRCGKTGRHKISKLLYFADQYHLANHGRPIIGDRYIAMANGPVPSRIYDNIKEMEGTTWGEKLESRGFYLIGKEEPDMDELSESDIEALDFSIGKYMDYGFGPLTRASHGYAWVHADYNNEISNTDILIETGAPEDMIAYASENARISLL